MVIRVGIVDHDFERTPRKLMRGWGVLIVGIRSTQKRHSVVENFDASVDRISGEDIDESHQLIVDHVRDADTIEVFMNLRFKN